MIFSSFPMLRLFQVLSPDSFSYLVTTTVDYKEQKQVYKCQIHRSYLGWDVRPVCPTLRTAEDGRLDFSLMSQGLDKPVLHSCPCEIIFLSISPKITMILRKKHQQCKNCALVRQCLM